MQYKINLPHIAHETIDGEAFIINTTNGMYFVAAGIAAIIWNAIAAGYSFTQISKALEAGRFLLIVRELQKIFFLYY